jgi:putative aminopeptidase FrvX
LCIKDSGGPYHEGLNKKMRGIAEKHGIPYTRPMSIHFTARMVKPSGAQAVTWRFALIGPGIDASHNYERAHMDGLNATTNWIMAYLLEGRGDPPK